MIKIAKIKKMYVLSFIFALHISISAYISSVFLTQFISENYVGILYTLASLFTLILLTKSSGILKNLGNRRLTLIFLLINMFSLVGLIISKNPLVVATSFILFTTTNTLVYFCIDIFIEHFGDPKTIGKTRGLYLTILNVAWMVSPIISVFLITKEGGYQAIYILAFIMVLLMTVGLFFSVKTFKDKVYKKTSFIETFKYLRTNPHMFAIVIINFILQFFFAWMVVYTPIYLFSHLNFTWNQIGIIFTIMLTPFVILGLPTGILIDKYHVSKRTLLYIGFIIIIISTSIISFITTKNVAIWAIILFMTRVGASFIETTSETYFFTHIQEEDAYLLGIFRDMNPIAYIIAPLIATCVFIFLPFNYLFIVLSLILLIGLYYIPKLKHSHGTN